MGLVGLIAGCLCCVFFVCFVCFSFAVFRVAGGFWVDFGLICCGLVVCVKFSVLWFGAMLLVCMWVLGFVILILISELLCCLF